MTAQQTGAHQPVMLREAVKALAIKPNGVYVDGTFGRGGHSRAILDQLGSDGRLLVLDRDPAAIEVAEKLAGEDSRVSVRHASFGDLVTLVEMQGLVSKVDGVLLDLGVSSPQLDDPARGFSFAQDGPLDMRFDLLGGSDAGSWLARASLGEIARVIRQYGEEPAAKRIARAICEAREDAPIATTKQLAELVAAQLPKHNTGRHPATRVFQAIRIHINGELEALESGLTGALHALSKGGRLVVISFHSLEDRLVKRFIRAQEDPKFRKLPLLESQRERSLSPIGKAQFPSGAELQKNRRARSAVLRVAEKL